MLRHGLLLNSRPYVVGSVVPAIQTPKIINTQEQRSYLVTAQMHLLPILNSKMRKCLSYAKIYEIFIL
jgi:hypothetical protein